MSTVTAPVETVGFTVTAPAAPTQEEHVKKAFGKSMKKYNPPTPPPGGPKQDGGRRGSPPATFHGDRALADNFLDELKLYFHLNWAVPVYQSHITRATFALTYIKGEQVAGWVRDFGEFLDTLDPLYV